MIFLRVVAAALCLALGASAAFADDWRVLSLQGTARTYSGGGWYGLAIGAPLLTPAQLQTGADGRAIVGRDGDALLMEPGAEIGVEGAEPGRALVRTFKGGLGVVERDAPGKAFTVMTTFTQLEAKGARFGVVSDDNGTLLTVREGLVVATDLMTREATMVGAGQSYRAGPGRHGALTAIAPSADPAGAAADKAGAPQGLAAEPGAGGAMSADRAPTGSLAATKSDPTAVEQAAAAIHRERAKIGKADPRAVAAVESMERDLLTPLEYETEPLADDFQWTEWEDGQLRLKPISRIVYNLQGAERFEFWTILTLVCLVLGALTNWIMEDAGFGALANAVVVMVAFFTAILVRDLFFRGSDNIAIEPYLSVGLMFAAMPLLLLGGAVAKTRMP